MCAGPSLHCSPQALLRPHRAPPAQACLGLGDTELVSNVPWSLFHFLTSQGVVLKIIHCNLPSWVSRVGSPTERLARNTAKL